MWYPFTPHSGAPQKVVHAPVSGYNRACTVKRGYNHYNGMFSLGARINGGRFARPMQFNVIINVINTLFPKDFWCVSRGRGLGTPLLCDRDVGCATGGFSAKKFLKAGKNLPEKR